VLTAADGERGVAVFEERRGDIALVILDLTMPRLSGAEAIQRLHAIDPEVPVLLTSGYAEDQVIDEYGVERFAGYLQKPYPPQVLVDVVRQALRKG